MYGKFLCHDSAFSVCFFFHGLARHRMPLLYTTFIFGFAFSAWLVDHYPIPCYGTKNRGCHNHFAFVPSRETLHVIHYHFIVLYPAYRLFHTCFIGYEQLDHRYSHLRSSLDIKHRLCAPGFLMPGAAGDRIVAIKIVVQLRIHATQANLTGYPQWAHVHYAYTSRPSKSRILPANRNRSFLCRLSVHSSTMQTRYALILLPVLVLSFELGYAYKNNL